MTSATHLILYTKRPSVLWDRITDHLIRELFISDLVVWTLDQNLKRLLNGFFQSLKNFSFLKFN